VLSTHRTYLTAAALWRSAVICRAEGGLRPAFISTNFGAKGRDSEPCRMPAAPLTLDKSQQEEGSP